MVRAEVEGLVKGIDVASGGGNTASDVVELVSNFSSTLSKSDLLLHIDESWVQLPEATMY